MPSTYSHRAPGSALKIYLLAYVKAYGGHGARLINSIGCWFRTGLSSERSSQLIAPSELWMSAKGAPSSQIARNCVIYARQPCHGSASSLKKAREIIEQRVEVLRVRRWDTARNCIVEYGNLRPAAGLDRFHSGCSVPLHARSDRDVGARYLNCRMVH